MDIDSPTEDSQQHEHSNNEDPAIQAPYAPNDVYVSGLPKRAHTPLSKPHESATLIAQHKPPDASALPSFLQRINIADLLPPFAPLDHWTYEQRRKAQRILHYLHLGPWTAINAEFLQSTGITMIVMACAGTSGVGWPSQTVLNAASADPAVRLYSLSIDPSQPFSLQFGAAIRAINTHVASRNAASDPPARAEHINGRVFVCCESGNGRSAALVMAYLMQTLQFDMRLAHRVLHDRRFSVHLDNDVKGVLETYGDLLAAQRMVSAARVSGLTSAEQPLEPKRSRSEDDSDEEMSDTYPRPFVPFDGNLQI